MPQIPINLLGVKPAAGFDYPPGKYIFKTVDLEVKTDNDGKRQYLSVSNEIVMGPGASTEYTGKKIRARYNLDGQGLQFLMNYLLAVGVTEAMLASTGGAPATEWMLEKQFAAEVIKRDKFTNIINEKPLDAGAAFAAPPIQSPFSPTPGFAPNQGFAAPPQMQQFAAPPQMQQFAPPPQGQQLAQPPQYAPQPQQVQQAYAPQPQQVQQPQIQQPQIQQQQFIQPQGQYIQPQQPPIAAPQLQQPMAIPPLPPIAEAAPQAQASMPQQQQVNPFPAPPPPPTTVGG